ncbi:MAG: phosphate ABC transporter permease subunit PstC, partial [Planctomycetota bacterium]|nr:phosphate ABC transporter permease subunit PstC [Planctomycetota bacterium]
MTETVLNNNGPNKPGAADARPGFLGRKSRPLELIAESIVRMSAWSVIVVLALIFVFIGKEALPIFTSPEVREEVTIGDLFLPVDADPAFDWQPISRKPRYSLLPLALGTLKATLVALLVAIPLGLGAAIFSSEFAPVWMRELLKPIVELLAGIPSVVLGFFALIVLASWLQAATGWEYRLNAVNAGIAMGLAIIPTIFTVAEDAFNAVPRSYREGSLALGANRWQTAWRVALPAAFPGVFAACVLGFGRAIGETMIVLMAAGNSPMLTLDVTRPARTLSATIAAELGEAYTDSPHWNVIFFIGALLFVVTFIANLTGRWFVTRLKR